MPARSSPAKRALKMARMSAGVAGSYLGYLVQRAFLGEDARESRLKVAHGRAARRVRDDLQSLRGPAMKLGQALSLQSGVLPEETLLELSKLQRDAPPMHATLMRVQFRASMGRDPEDLFKTFEPEPFAAASLGQVHRATTRRGEDVAVKIQYPGIREAIEHDFAWFRTVSRPAQISGHLPKKAIDELQRQIIAETDYAAEAANIDAFRTRLTPLAYVTVPHVYRELSSGQVLTMSRIEGRHLDEFLARRPSQKLRDLIGERLFELFYFQVLKTGAFHADPHPGNYLFGDDGTIGMVDFGCVKRLTPAFVADLRSIYLYAGDRRSRHFESLLEKRHALFGDKFRPAARRALMDFAEHFYRKVYPPERARENEPFDFGKSTALQDYLRESNKLMKAKGVMTEYVFLARCEVGLYHTLQRLRARVHTSRIVRQFLDRPE